MSENNTIQKALSIATGGSMTGYLPDPMVKDVINTIRDVNVMRRLIRAFTMNSRTFKRPKKSSNLTGYYVPDGVTATVTGFSTTNVTWEAKKLMTYCLADAEVFEDSIVDVVNQILFDSGEALGEAEELALCAGDTAHLATAPTPESATTSNWFRYDPRLIFDGVWKYAESVTACTAVNAASAKLNLDMINEALYNMGKYGRSKSKLMGLLPSVQAAMVRQDAALKNAAYSGMGRSTQITGLPGAGENDNYVTHIYGIPFYEVPGAAVDTEIVIQRRDACSIGDRRKIKLKTSEVIESDEYKYVASERIAFQYELPEAMVRIYGLSTDLTTAVSS